MLSALSIEINRAVISQKCASLFRLAHHGLASEARSTSSNSFMKLQIKPDKNRQQLVHVTPESADWVYVSFSAYQLAPGETLTVTEDAKELCAIILAGIVSAKAGDQAWAARFQRAM